jgi:dehydrogenase/reductase SDR family member 1
MGSLTGRVALVTGASRGLGKGIALGLGEAGATVYVSGRSTEERPGVLPGTVGATADAVTRLGGQGVAVPCDHRVDGEVEALFAQVAREQGRLDILINNAFASPEQRVLWGGQRFWEIPLTLWDDLIDVGLRSHFVTSWHAAPLMIAQRSGLVVNVASHAAAPGTNRLARSRAILPYSVGKAGLHRLSANMAGELREFDVAVVSIWPPASRTEGMLAQPMFDNVGDWKPPLFTGRVVAAFASTGEWLARSGEALVVDDLAKELGVTE